MFRTKGKENGPRRSRRQDQVRARIAGDRARPIIANDRSDKNNVDDDEMEADELELIGLEARLLPPGSPATNGVSSTSALSRTPGGVPFQSTFPVGPLLEKFQRVPSRSYNNPFSAYPTEFKPLVHLNSTTTSPSTPQTYLDHRNSTLHLRSKSFSIPRKISHSSSLSSDSSAGTDIDSPLDPSDSDGDDTDVDQEDEEDLSGAECESKVLDEIERENQRFYLRGAMRDGFEKEAGSRDVKGKGKARAGGRMGLGPTVSDVTSCLKMLVSCQGFLRRPQLLPVPIRDVDNCLLP